MKITDKIKTKLANKDFKMILSSVSYLSFENVFRMVLGLALSILIARYLGSELYGQFNYIISFVAIFIPFYMIGVDDITVRKFIEEPEMHNKIAGTSFLLKIVGGIMGTIVCIFSIIIIKNDQPFIVFLVSLYATSMLFKSLDVINDWYLSQVLSKKISMIRNVVFVTMALLKFVCLSLKLSWEWFVYIACLEVILIGVSHIIIYTYDGYSIFKFKIYRGKLKEFIDSSFPLFFIIFLSWALTRIDQIMIAELSGNSELGQYAVAIKLVDLWQFLPHAVISSLFPAIIAGKRKDEGNFKKRTIYLYSIILWLSLLLAISVTIISKPLINYLYGEFYIKSQTILMLYVWTTIFTYFNHARVKIFVIEGSLNIGVILGVLTVIIDVLFNYILIPIYSSYGAIIALVLAYIISNLFMCIFSRSVRRSCLYFFQSFLIPLKLLK